MKRKECLVLQSVVLFAVVFCSSCSSPKWIAVGPYSAPNMHNYVPVAGRVDDIQIAYNYDGKGGAAMFLACPGGIWRSTDFTSSNPNWEPLTDHIPNIPDARRFHINDIESISIDPNNPKNIWATAGGNPLALLNSTDGGNNWSLIGQGQFTASNRLWRVLIDPFGFIWVACDNGFYVSENQGTSFLRIDSGDVSGKDFQDMVWYSTKPLQLNIYVGVIDRNTQDNKSGIWQVSGSNGNFNWTKMPINLQNIYGSPVADTLMNSIRLYADQNGAVASISKDGDSFCKDPTGSIWGLLNVFQLEGNTWQPKWKIPSGTVGSDVQRGYVQPIYITPDNRIYGGGKGLEVSDGKGGVLPVGGTIAKLEDCKITNENAILDKNQKTYHPDVHAVRYCSLDRKMYMATDGGIVRFTPNFNISGVVDLWEPLNTPSLINLLTMSVAMDNSYDMLAGHQDNGVLRLYNQWDYAGGNETDYVFFDPFGTGYYMDCSGGCRDLVVSTDGGKSFSQILKLPPAERNQLLCFYSTQQNRMMIPTHNHNPEFPQYTVFETTNGWKDASNLNPPIDDWPTAISYAGENIYIASKQQIYLSKDDGATWSKLWTSPAYIISICPDPNNPNGIYVATQDVKQSGRVFFSRTQSEHPTLFRKLLVTFRRRY